MHLWATWKELSVLDIDWHADWQSVTDCFLLNAQKYNLSLGVLMEMNQRNLEVWLGLTEVVMIRLPLNEWVNHGELATLTQIATSDPLPNDWPSLQSEVARTSLGFRDWLGRLSRHQWQPSQADERIKSKIAAINFELPWCARLRWGARNLKNVDVFIHATGGADPIKWESIHERTSEC